MRRALLAATVVLAVGCASGPDGVAYDESVDPGDLYDAPIEWHDTHPTGPQFRRTDECMCICDEEGMP